MRLFAGVAVLAAALLLSGCAQDTIVDHVASTEPRDSQPAFLDEPQDDSDLVDYDIASDGIDETTLRYQGSWEGLEIYLAIAGTNDIRILSHYPDDPKSWSVAGTNGNSELALLPTEDVTLQYVPQGTSVMPEGWSALSEWIAVRG